MPNVTMEVAAGADSTPDSYVEDGFVIATGQAPSLPGQTPNGLTIANDGDGHGDYLLPTFSNAEVFLESSTVGKTFGLLSIDLDGFVNSNVGADGIRSQSAPVTFTFIGINPNALFPLIFQFTTNNLLDFQTVALPSTFASGLVQVSWTVSGSAPNAWGAFDNLVLSTNTAPTALGVVGSTTTQTNGTVAGQLGGQDADGDALSFQLYAPVQGVSVAPNGAFFVQRVAADDDLLPGEHRTVTFQYTVTDGYEVSSVTTVSVNVYALPQGADICGGNHPQVLIGTAAGEHICGGNSGDTLSGLGGADTIEGDNGADRLFGGDGRDKLYGGNGSDTLDGGAGNDYLDGGNSPDVLIGGLGDDTMTGGNSPDEFYLGANWGHDVITDFDPKNEHIHMVPSPTLGGWTQFQALVGQGLIHQDGKNVVIDDGAGNTLLLLNVKLSSLGADDFIFG